MKAKTRSGFTVVELVISMTVMMSVFAGVLLVQLTSSRLIVTTATAGHLDDRALEVLERIATDVRWADGGAFLITQENGVDRLDIQLAEDYAAGAPVWSTTVTYRAEPSTIDANGNGPGDDLRLVRTQDGRRRVLTSQLGPGGFTIARVGGDVTVTLRLTKLDTSTNQVLLTDASTTISLRN